MAALGRWPSGTRAAVLVSALGISRTTLRLTLAALIEAGLVSRNPGYGHPLRPEYILTSVGKHVAEACADFDARVAAAAIAPLARRKWTAPILLAIRQGASRFSAMEATLPEISPRALTIALRALVAAELVTRSVEDAYPPVTAYALTAQGRSLAETAAAIAAALQR